MIWHSLITLNNDHGLTVLYSAYILYFSGYLLFCTVLFSESSYVKGCILYLLTAFVDFDVLKTDDLDLFFCLGIQLITTLKCDMKSFHFIRHFIHHEFLFCLFVWAIELL